MIKTKFCVPTILLTLLSVTIPISRIEALEKLDLTTVTCKDMLLMEGDQRDSTIVFFHGMIIGKKGLTVLDAGTLSNTTDSVLEHCVNNPQDKLMSVFEKYSK
jgi:hypothetical protein